MPNFNPSMLQQQQGQSQTQQGGQADNHQGMQQSFADQSQLWSQMQNLQQFRPNNGAEMNNPQMAQQASPVTLRCEHPPPGQGTHPVSRSWPPTARPWVYPFLASYRRAETSYASPGCSLSFSAFTITYPC